MSYTVEESWKQNLISNLEYQKATTLMGFQVCRVIIDLESESDYNCLFLLYTDNISSCLNSHQPVALKLELFM